MRSVTAIILLVFLARVYAKDLLVNTLSNKFVNELFDRVQKTSPCHKADQVLDNSTLGKPSHLAIATHARLRSIPLALASPTSAQAKFASPRPETFLPHSSRQALPEEPFSYSSSQHALNEELGSSSRRDALAASLSSAMLLLPLPAVAKPTKKAYNPKELYKNFKRTKSGLLVNDIANGDGKKPKKGDKIVVDWTGYTAGYNTKYVYTFGWRPFETARETTEALYILEDKDYLSFEVGKGSVIPGLEEAVLGMKEGGVRQLVIEDPARGNQRGLGYPDDDPTHDRVGPKPSTFAGQRALKSMLENPDLIDKTILFNIKIVRVDQM